MSTVWRLGIGVATAWLLIVPCRGAESTVEWVSSDAVLYLEVPRPGVLLDRASDERLLALAETVPGLREALRRPEVKTLRDVVTEVARELGKPWDVAVREITGGGAVLAVEAPRGRPPGIALIVTPTDAEVLEKAAGIVREIARREAANRGQDDPIASGEHRGIVGYSPRGTKAAYAIVEGKLVIADRSDTLKAVVDRALDGLPADRSVKTLEVWKAREDAPNPESLAWGMARLDILRELDPNRYRIEEKVDGGATLLFGGWIQTLRQAPWVSATLTWNEKRLAGQIRMPAPPGGRSAPFLGYVPPRGEGAPPPIHLPGTVLSASLWRDLSALWEAKSDLFRPEDAQNLNQLDTLSGTFFGGRDFGTGVLGSLTSDWRLIVAMQDHAATTPLPDVKLPAFALVAQMKPDAEDFAQRLKVAFQSFVGVVNLGSAQTKAPPLELLSETYEGVTLSTTRFMPPLKSGPDDQPPGPVHYRHNFSPTAVQVGPHFVLSSSVGLARELVKALKDGGSESPRDEPATFVVKADGGVMAKLVDLNRDQLVMRNVLEQGNDEARAGAEVDLLAALLRYLGEGRLAIEDGHDFWRLDLDFQLGR
ncbi:MAG: hypothetical protein AB7I30_01325 [Isosphaeraceae bacterium]